MKIPFLSILAIILSSTAMADEAFLGYGLGVFNSAKQSSGEVKAFQLGYRDDLIDGFYWQYKLGFWGDGSGDKGRSSSGYASTGPGFRVDLNPIEIRTGWGIAAITSPDSYLGGRFPQFNGELYMGVRDKHGNGIGFQYEHISSAGLVTPNQGRDLVILQMSQRW